MGLPGPAYAAFSGVNGKIVFEGHTSGVHIYTMDPDGTHVQQLTTGPASDLTPKWSADGARIVFTRILPGPPTNSEIYVMNADGTAQTRLTNDPAEDARPS